ncbi:MAG: polymer-forming cytoskeletal protein [Longicatena sp.]
MTWNMDDGRNTLHNDDMNAGNVAVKQEETIISQSTRIFGNIEIDGNLVVEGSITGDIQSSQSVAVFGEVTGNIESCDLQSDHAAIKGDIKCNGSVTLGESTVIEGNCEAENLICGGRIKGNVYTHNSLKLQEKAVLIGDISSMDIEINRGAVIQGKLDIRQEAFFDEKK